MARWPSHLEPKLFAVLREGYGLRDLVHDAMAGVVVGVVALPLAIAFAIASGVRPEQGLYTAIVAGFLIAVLSGSRVQIGGPTGAFVVLVAGIVGRHGYEGLVVATLLAGALLVAMGIARMGAVIRFIPYPVTVGFTSGIALIIAIGQVGDGLGLSLPHASSAALERLVVYGGGLGSTSPAALALCAGTVALVAGWHRVTPRVPGPLVALVVGTAATVGLGLPVETIGSRFGEIPSSLPAPRLPHIDFATVPELFSPALSIALLAGIESLLSAVVADGMTGRKHRPNAELVAQGVANLASPIFGGIPATGAIARTATNVRNGGRTPFAGMIHALTLVVILTTVGRWVALVPMAVLAGILLVVAYNMSEWRLFLGLLRGPRSDVLVLLTTFGLTVLVDLTVAIQVGVVLAALLFMRRMAEVSEVRSVTEQLRGDAPGNGEEPRVAVPERVEVFEVAGSFFFGAAQKFSETLVGIGAHPEVVILRMRSVPAMDATGLRALEEVWSRFRRQGTLLLLSGVQEQPRRVMERGGLLAKLGPDNLVPTFGEALERARSVTSAPPPRISDG